MAGEFGKPSAAVIAGDPQKFISCGADESEMAGWANRRLKILPVVHALSASHQNVNLLPQS